jgi:hypothetical protein
VAEALGPLADRFTAAECELNSGAAPWTRADTVEGPRLICPAEGSALSGERIGQVLREWAPAPPTAEPAKPSTARVLAGVIALVALVVIVIVGWPNRAGKRPAALQRGQPLVDKDEVKILRGERLEVDSFALIVGVDGVPGLAAGANREQATTQLDDSIGGASLDAARLYVLLRDHYGFGAENMRLLIDRPAAAAIEGDFASSMPPTRANIMAALEAVGAASRQIGLGRETTFVFYFAGPYHERELARMVGYLAPADFDPARPDATGINLGMLPTIIDQHVRSGHRLELLDTVVRKAALPGRISPQNARPPLLTVWHLPAHAAITMTTTARPEDGRGLESSFAFALAAGLSNEPEADINDDRIVTDEELFAYLSEQLADDELAAGAELTHIRRRPYDGNGQVLLIPRTVEDMRIESEQEGL